MYGESDFGAELEAIESERRDADMEQADAQAQGRAADAQAAKYEASGDPADCPHGSRVGYLVPSFYPDQDGLTHGEERCCACKTVLLDWGHTFTIVVNGQDVSYQDENGDDMEGDHRVLSDHGETVYTLDGDDVLEHGGVIAAAVAYVKEQYPVEASSWPIQGAEHEWLSATADLYTYGCQAVEETTVRLGGDFTPQQRAEVFTAALAK